MSPFRLRRIGASPLQPSRMATDLCLAKCWTTHRRNKFDLRRDQCWTPRVSRSGVARNPRQAVLELRIRESDRLSLSRRLLREAEILETRARILGDIGADHQANRE